jgi:chemosensory pili system protein ChpA (sensor histidine kinase/response regulator)
MTLILLLEDNADLRQTLKQAIELDGHEVHGGRSGEDGLEFLRTAPTLPDMIICDISMPDMNGFEFLKHVRGNPEWANIRFVVMSGTRADRDIALASGADGYLGKPFGFSELKNIVDQAGKS